jgi:hypothetical protein
MKKEEFDKWIDNRYNPQVKWYDEKSNRYKNLTHAFQIPIIVLAAVTPIFAALEYKEITIMSSALVTAGIGILKYCKFEELWHNYRTTCEALKTEKAYYDMKIGIYESVDKPENHFVERVESIFSKEHIRWESAIKEKKIKEDLGDKDE